MNPATTADPPATADDSGADAQTGQSATPADQLTCDICGRSFKNKQGLSMHKARTHSKKYGNRRKASEKPATPKPLTDGQIAQRMLNALQLNGSMNAHQVTRTAAWLEEGLAIRNSSRGGQ